jgi:phage shock protein PspC (stress-responsive transcriptional regulator)
VFQKAEFALFWGFQGFSQCGCGIVMRDQELKKEKTACKNNILLSCIANEKETHLKKAMKIIHNIRHYFERHGFNVSSRFADKLGMGVKSIRLTFIYLSFATLGVSFFIYLTLAFLLKLKDMLYRKRTSVFDL